MRAVLLIALIAGPSEALSQSLPASRPALLEALLACRAIGGEVERLACFDRSAGAIETAEREGEVTVVDRATARETRTRLFGLDLGSANLFGNLRQDDPIEAVETTLVSARQAGRDKWTFVLADGSTWNQTDSERLTIRPTPGASVRIRRGAVGSYLLSVSGARSIRARRER